MSLSNIKPYFRSRLDGLGFTEWLDGFSTDNIPQTILNQAYHILVESTDGGPINHTHQDTNSRVRVRLFYRGYANPSVALDEALVGVETIVKDVCKVANRTSMLLNVIFESADYQPLNEDNDNSVLVEMVFTARVILGVEET